MMQYDGWSVSAQYRKCGKPNCRVCAHGPGHGPYWYGTRVVNGKKQSKYFGRRPPIDAQDDIQDMQQLRRALSHAQAEIALLQERIRALESENEALRARLEPPRRELTRAQVEEIWQAAEKHYRPEIIEAAHDSLMRILFPDSQDTTRLRTGTGVRPYVCPFRGPRYRFASPEKLVENAIPWLLEAKWREWERKQARAQEKD